MQIQHIIVARIYSIQIYTLGEYVEIELYIYIVIVFILPTIGKHLLVGFIFCDWIYFANNWGLYVNWRGHIIYVCILD